MLPGRKHLVIVPAFNEQDALAQTVARLERLPEAFEVLIVNDGSTDRTSQVAHALAKSSRRPIHVIDLPHNGGIGVAVQTGYLFAQRAGVYHFVLQFDADGQHNADEIVRLVEACEARGWDLGIGSRFLAASAGFRSTFLRRVGIRFFSGLISSIAGTRVTDPTSGFRCVGPRAWQSFARRYPDDYPEPESLYWCIRNGLSVGEIPVVMFERQGGVSSIRALGPAYYMLKVTLSILVDWLRRNEASA